MSQSNFTKAVINLSKPCDVHYTHTHPDTLVVLYYINLSWNDEYAGETLFYSNEDEVIYTSKYKARKLVCSQARPDEIEDIYKWLYDNITLFGDEEKQEKAILIIKQGLVDHTLVSDPEINLAATMIKLASV